jgi:hypothetical protein
MVEPMKTSFSPCWRTPLTVEIGVAASRSKYNLKDQQEVVRFPDRLMEDAQ